VRLVSWNVAGRTDGPRADRLSAQAEAIWAEHPDLVALQEVTCTTIRPWRQKLSEMELGFCADTVDRLAGDRRYANLLASRWPLSSEAALAGTTFPEKILSVAASGVEVHVFHAPTGVGSGWGKVDALEALHRRLSEPSAVPRIVCGDFNAPQAEPTGRPLVTFAQIEATAARLDQTPRWFADWLAKHPTADPWDPERWDRAERQLLSPAHLGLVDVFRDLNPSARDASWVWHRGETETPRRFDHLFASPALRPW
jgi:exonuclease III